MASLEEQQVALLRRMAKLDPPPCFMGGFAEDALLAGTITRAHEDIDWLLPRRDLELRLAQAAGLGFREFEVWGEAAPGEPFYLFGQNGELKLDLGVADEAEGTAWMKVHRLSFTVAGKEAPAGYRLRLPDDIFDHPMVAIDGIEIHPASPLALYQTRVGVAEQGSFGPLSERQLEATRRLKDRFFPNSSEDELRPAWERLE